jgi:CubicO group peptidase (beta-lactamase class C family)
MLKSLNEELVMKQMLSQAPMLSEDVDFFPSSTKSWSPGFMINHEDIDSGRPKNSAGWAGLFNSFFWIDPKNEIAAVILMQMLPFSEGGCLNTLKEFESSIYS